jgi:Fic family protein
VNRLELYMNADAPESGLRLHDVLKRRPFASASLAARETGLTVPTVNRALEQLTRLGIVAEVTGKKRGRVFAYRRYLSVLNDSD